ncbi:MAG: signal peptidase II [Deltaproteobacteria bacterium]|nr:signal peptidase II [Deltaproteobacteria bacterium]
MTRPFKYKLLFLISLHGVILLDVLTKRAVMSQLPLNHIRAVIPGFFNLVHIRNRGVAFGILNNAETFWKDFLLVLFPVAAMIGILWLLYRYPRLSAGTALALGAIVGGAAGNLLDRLRYRGVVDFLDFYWRGFHWPAFNVADMAISVGVGFLIFRFWREG